MKSTRYYSNKQETYIAHTLKGKKVANSGATAFMKGDVIVDNILIEAKTCTVERNSFSIKKEWLDKNKEEAFAMNKDYSVLAFNYGPDTDNYYILDEHTFKEFVQLLHNKEK